MNPSIPVMIVLMVGLILLKRNLAPIVISLGVVGMLLLLPALSTPSGVVTNASLLEQEAPWAVSSAGAKKANPHASDVVMASQPYMLFLRDEVRNGRLPLWNPFQFAGMSFWGNGQGSPMFPLNWLFIACPLQVGLNLFPWLIIVAGGFGTWYLARELEIEHEGALFAATIFPLSGGILSYLDFQMGNAMMLTPWVLLCVERIVNRRGSWIAPAVVGSVQFFAGHPETVLLTGLISALYLFVRGRSNAQNLESSAVDNVSEQKQKRLQWPERNALYQFAAGWLLALALSSVCFLPLLHTVFESAKWHSFTAAAEQEPSLEILLKLPFRVLFPNLYGDPIRGTWWGPFDSLATAVYVGIVPLLLALSGIYMSLKDRRVLAITVVMIFSFLTAYHLPGPYYLVHAVPPFNHVLVHRLLCVVDLCLALLAGTGLSRWIVGEERNRVGAASLSLMSVIVVAWFIFQHGWSQNNLWEEHALRTGWAIVAIVLLAAWTLGSSAKFRKQSWFAIAVCAIADLMLSHTSMVAAYPFESFFPATNATTFLKSQNDRVAGAWGALLPNAAMVYRLRDVRGYDPVMPERYLKAYSQLSNSKSLMYAPIQNWQQRMLDFLSVRWVMTRPQEHPDFPEWRLAYTGNDARIYERPSALPMVRWQETKGAENIRIVEERPGYWLIDWRSEKANRLIIGEVWDAGWSATNGIHSVAVKPVDDLLIGIELPPGDGQVRLQYWPVGLTAGMWISAMALVSVLVGWRMRLRRKRSQT